MVVAEVGFRLDLAKRASLYLFANSLRTPSVVDMLKAYLGMYLRLSVHVWPLCRSIRLVSLNFGIHAIGLPVSGGGSSGEEL